MASVGRKHESFSLMGCDIHQGTTVLKSPDPLSGRRIYCEPIEMVAGLFFFGSSATVDYRHLRLTDEGDVLVASLLAGTLIDQNVIDETGKELLEAAFEACGNHKLVVNFRAVNFMSSAMLGKLMPLHKRCKADKTKLKLCNICPNLLEVFKSRI